MLVLDWLVVALSGRLVMLLFDTSPLSGWLKSLHPVMDKILSCGLCLGFWTYLLMYLFLDINGIIFIQNKIFCAIISAALTSFIVWMFEAGWKAKYTNIIIE
jgi:hypothetical protein